MHSFIAKRFIAEFSHIAPAIPARVFPLLCPVRELEWIPGWNYEMVYATSGLAETNGVFTSQSSDRGKATYFITRHDRINSIIEFVIFFPELLVEKLNISVSHHSADSSLVHWQRIYTGLSPAGNQWITEHAEKVFQQRMSILADAMIQYIKLGSQHEKY